MVILQGVQQVPASSSFIWPRWYGLGVPVNVFKIKITSQGNGGVVSVASYPLDFLQGLSKSFLQQASMTARCVVVGPQPEPLVSTKKDFTPNDLSTSFRQVQCSDGVTVLNCEEYSISSLVPVLPQGHTVAKWHELLSCAHRYADGSGKWWWRCALHILLNWIQHASPSLLTLWLSVRVSSSFYPQEVGDQLTGLQMCPYYWGIVC